MNEKFQIKGSDLSRELLEETQVSLYVLFVDYNHFQQKSSENSHNFQFHSEIKVTSDELYPFLIFDAIDTEHYVNIM